MQRALAVLRRGLPFQSLLTAAFDWDSAIAGARRSLGDFDVTIVILSRVDPWARASLGNGMKILDSVDSLRRNAEERGNAASLLTRWFWRREERLLARAEDDVADAYDRIILVNDEELSDFGDRAVAIANGVRVEPLDPGAPRQFDFGFWGRLAYFANADAARWLIDEIWPAILERNPAVSCVIAGADAPRSIRRAAERSGITFLSPVDSVAVLARSVCVAIIPVRHGSGQLNKVVEAGEAGCAIVATRQSLRGLAPLVPFVQFADDAQSFAATALALLKDDERATMASALRHAVVANYSRAQILAELAKVAGVQRAAEAVTA
ncbi:MAG: hypothetical protein QOK37_3206 [Thermoanaerobaculia bacterium]|jgi:glycosyltransferase involved in cell wall biosynthesis|nr:hypothetical protein [Thermoanaerobaculia bacterium]